MNNSIAWFLFFLLFLSLHVGAKELVVSQTGTSLRTIQEAVNVATPGDVIKVRGGTYNETVNINKNNITIEAYDLQNEPVEIDGSIKIPKGSAWRHVSGKIYKIKFKWPWRMLNDSDITRKNVPVQNCLEGRFPIPMMQVYEDGILLRGYRNKYDEKYMRGKKTNGLYLGTKILAGPYEALEQLDPKNSGGKIPRRSQKEDIRIPGRFLYKEKEGELYVWSAKEDNPVKHSYCIQAMPSLCVIKNVKGTVLRNLIFSYASACALVMENAEGSTVENCFFMNNFSSIFAIKSNNLTIKRNLFQNNGFWERYFYEDTKLTRLGVAQIELGEPKDLTSMKNCRFYENTLRGGAYMIVAAGQNFKIYNNIIACSTNLGVSARNFDTGHPGEKFNLQVFNNIFHHQDQLCAGLNSVNRGPAYFYRNIAYASYCFSKGTGSKKEYSGGQPSGEARTFVYNNTFAFMTRIIGHWYKTGQIKKEQVYVNNIFYMKSRRFLFKKKKKGLFDVSQYFKPGFHDNWTYYPFNDGPLLDYNLYWTQEPDTHEIYAIKTKKINERFTKKDFPDMIRKMQIEQHGFQKDPMFLNKKEFDSTYTENIKFDNFSDMDYRAIIKKGYDKLFKENFQKLREEFALSPESPAINAGKQIPSDWPDLNQVKDGKTDIGAIEFHKPGFFASLFGWL